MIRFILVAVLSVGACEGSSPIERVSFTAVARGAPRDVAIPFTTMTRTGWSVTVDTALLHIGAVYLRNSVPIAGTTADEGRVIAQVITPFTVDALDPTPRTVGLVGVGTTEPARSAELWLLDASEGPIVDRGGRRAIGWVGGVARRDGMEVRFEGRLAIPEGPGVTRYDEAVLRRVLRIPASVTATSGGTMVIEVDPSRWLDAVDFDTLEPPTSAIKNFESQAARVQIRNAVGASMGVYRIDFVP